MSTTHGALDGESNTIGTRCTVSLVHSIETTSTMTAPAHKILLGNPVSVETGGRVLRGQALAIPAGTEHRILAADGALGLVATFDPRRFRFGDVERLMPRFRSFVLGQDEPLELYADALKLPAPRLDARLDKAVTMLELGVSVAEIARRLRLSESRLSHLYAERLGAPLRTWRAWLLLRRGMLEVYSGSSVTEAAHSAGFADAAHMSRTHRNTLGIPPSRLLDYRTRFVTDRLSVLDCSVLRTSHRSPRLVANAIWSAYGR